MRDRSDYRLSVLFVALLAIEFIVAPLHSANILRAGSESGIAGGVLAICAAIVLRRRSARLGVTALAIAGIIISPHAAELSIRFVVLLFLGAVAANAVFRNGRITVHRVLGSMALYILVALIFSTAYQAIAEADPSSFTSTATWNPLYFSLVTITTTGYGDIVPHAPIARSLATLEAIFGQLYTATVIARLVTLEIAHTSQSPDQRSHVDRYLG